MTECTHDWTTMDPTGGDPAIGGPATIVFCGKCGVENRMATALLAHGRKERAEGYAAGLRDAQVDVEQLENRPDDQGGQALGDGPTYVLPSCSVGHHDVCASKLLHLAAEFCACKCHDEDRLVVAQ